MPAYFKIIRGAVCVLAIWICLLQIARAADNTDLVFQVADGRPSWILRYKVKSAIGAGQDQMIGAAIADQSSNRILQILDFEKNIAVDFDPDTYLSENIVTDLNFDNFQDLAIPIRLGEYGNISYAVWLFDSMAQKYVYNSALSNLTNIDVDADKKQIVSSEKCCGGTSGVENTYEWRNGALFLIKEFQYTRLDPQPNHPASAECKNAVWMVDTTRIWNGGRYVEQRSDPYAMCE